MPEANYGKMNRKKKEPRIWSVCTPYCKGTVWTVFQQWMLRKIVFSLTCTNLMSTEENRVFYACTVIVQLSSTHTSFAMKKVFTFTMVLSCFVKRGFRSTNWLYSRHIPSSLLRLKARAKWGIDKSEPAIFIAIESDTIRLLA